jgi:hypothetical protein
MKDHEEELQRSVEKGKVPQSADGYAYSKLFSVLAKDPGYLLPSSFADTVIERIKLQHHTFGTVEKVFICTGFFLLLLSLAVAIALTGFTLHPGFLAALSEYAGVLVFGCIFIALLHFIDKQFVRNRYTSS